MAYVRPQHPNAALNAKQRRRMVGLVLDQRWTVEAAARQFQVDAKTARKWRDRFAAEGEAGLHDRSSRPRVSPNATPAAKRAEVVRLRRQRRWGADHIGHEVGLAASTVQSILRSEGLARLDRGDRATAAQPVRRYVRDRPGELIHVDIKKIAAIPDGGGWRTRGRGYAGHSTRLRVGYRCIHTALDDRSRLVYSEIHHDEKAHTAAAFWARAAAWFAARGIDCERVLTDNGPCYRSSQWRQACKHTGTAHKRTRPYRPQTNGKVERFHRILTEEWAYIRHWTSETQRHNAYTGFIHYYNHHRSHGALNWATPASTLQDNLPEDHT